MFRHAAGHWGYSAVGHCTEGEENIDRLCVKPTVSIGINSLTTEASSSLAMQTGTSYC